MIDRPTVLIHRLPGRDLSPADGLTALLTAYHLCTEAEKGRAVERAEALPTRYRTEILSPHHAFADDVVVVARSEGASVGCLVVTAPVGGRSEIKRLWVDPAMRGAGVASALVGCALDHAAEIGASPVALSVWSWRTGAIALYERLGFTVVDSWDAREGLVCMERA
ncbi:GNAT family N-acetyltransferase [Streptomyces finlayi]|uniref:GNAT family N-acetyltransferase n=1 Tax=Streptomyces finlayi TaxID=67296 RepID=A0A7G7BTP1_9ACTN|nr:GNAT family N-acetyltransferase [Streptomyces finlayi]QNE78706.1 GNAT family N-acetyltransferase [Streptomyces finlayi]